MHALGRLVGQLGDRPGAAALLRHGAHLVGERPQSAGGALLLLTGLRGDLTAGLAVEVAGLPLGLAHHLPALLLGGLRDRAARACGV
nr:hypothetical protein [Micromonospora provocatoris]